MPVPLSAAPEVPAFPLWALPEWLGEYAASLAEVTQTMGVSRGLVPPGTHTLQKFARL